MTAAVISPRGRRRLVTGPRLRSALLGAALAFGVSASAACAQTGASAVGLPDVPTTRTLAIGHLTPAATPAALRGVMADEVADTVRLYLTGKVADWYLRKDQPGVVFMLDVRDVAEARALLAPLPLVRSGLMAFDLVPLGPLAPLGLLLPKR